MKRPIDFLLALCLLLIFSGLILLIWLSAFAFLGRPVIFKQQRVGQGERIFTLYKFRTMSDKKDHAGQVLSDQLRLTKFGKFLRTTSLDELPQLWNVLKGDMNFVGPRPLLVEYLPLYNTQQKRRHLVKPGMTGWAQVNGRNTLSWQEKFNLDIWYVEHRGMILDIKILFLTFLKIFKREGINQAEGTTMTKFNGWN